MGNCSAITQELYKLIHQSLSGDMSILELPILAVVSWGWGSQWNYTFYSRITLSCNKNYTLRTVRVGSTAHGTSARSQYWKLTSIYPAYFRPINRFIIGNLNLLLRLHATILLKGAFPFLPEASFGLRVLSLPASVCLCVCLSVCVSVNPELVRAINHHAFKLEPPNLDKRCKTTWLRSLLFLGAIDLDLQCQI